ncbi:outer membrane protein assembly factor BamA, partial [Arcobacter sp. 31_11_sub10_T18]
MKKSIVFIASTLITTLLSAEQIKRIDFINLSRMSPKIANETIDFKVGDELDIPKVNSAIKKFYKFGYFDDIKVQNENGVVQFVFKEKPVIANIEMTGYKEREEDLDLVYSKMGIKKGYFYTKKRLETAKKTLLLELEKEGYINSVVEVNVEEINEDSVALNFDVNKGEAIVIKKVNYFGSKELEESDFEEIIVNKKEDYLGWFWGFHDGEVKLDQLSIEQPRIRDLYFQHGFLDSTVKKPFMKIDFSSNTAELNYFITEGNQYNTNDIKIFLDSSILDPKTLYPELLLRKDRVFDIALLRKDVELIKTAVADLGYAFTEVKYDLKKDKKTSKVDVILNVIPGEKVYINDVIISGNGRTLDRVIRRNVYLAPGDLFNLTDFTDSKNKLQRSGFFDTVEISKKRITSTTMDLIVNVKETSTGNIILGGGYGSYDGFLITAGIKDQNVFGSGKAVGIKVDYSSHKQDIDLFLKEPSINDSKYNGSINIYSKTREIEYGSPKYTFEKKSIGIALGAGTELFRNT